MAMKRTRLMAGALLVLIGTVVAAHATPRSLRALVTRYPETKGKLDKCGTCHTTYPYLMARRALDPKAPALLEMRAFFEKRIANWDSGKKEDLPRRDTRARRGHDAQRVR